MTSRCHQRGLAREAKVLSVKWWKQRGRAWKTTVSCTMFLIMNDSQAVALGSTQHPEASSWISYILACVFSTHISDIHKKFTTFKLFNIPFSSLIHWNWMVWNKLNADFCPVMALDSSVTDPFLSVVQFSANICLEETDGCGVFSHWKEQWVFCWVKSR